MQKVSDKTALMLKIKEQNRKNDPKTTGNAAPQGGQKRQVKNRSLKKRVIGGTAAGTVAAGVLLSGLFSSPAELTKHNEQHYQNKPAIEQVIDMDVEEEEEQEDGEYTGIKKKKGLRTKLKEKILELPVIVRALVGVPLWAIGWGIVTGLDLLWGAASPVVLPIIVKLLLLLLVIFAIVFLVMKAIHPDMPAKEILKKIFKKRNISCIIIAAIVLTAADTVLLLAWDGYEPWRRLVIFVAGLVLLFLILRPFIFKKKQEPVIS